MLEASRTELARQAPALSEVAARQNDEPKQMTNLFDREYEFGEAAAEKRGGDNGGGNDFASGDFSGGGDFGGGDFGGGDFGGGGDF